jgi:uncharacterized protein (TIGR02145 family)
MEKTQQANSLKNKYINMKTLAALLFCGFTLISNAQSFTCGDTLLDIRDGKKYTTVLIGTACWMKQNLNYGTTITSNTSATTHYDMANNSVAEKYAPNGDPSKLAAYGALYEWDELMQYNSTAGGQGLCPGGWHVPTDAEWQTMIAAAGGTVVPGAGGNKLKALGEGFGAGAGTNTSGFSAKAAGDRDAFGIFYGLTLRSIFWTSTQTNTASAYHYTLWAEKDTIERLITQKMTGLSCRCVKDAATGLNEKSKKDLFRVYPNPANEKIIIELNYSAKNTSCKIINVVGEVVKEEIISEIKTEISLEGLSEGIYFIVVNSNEGRMEKKIVITRK